MSRILTYRGLLADGGQDKIKLQTIKGKIGYTIVKLQVMPEAPFTESEEHILKIYTIEQSTVDGVVDFSVHTLLAAAAINNHSSGYSDPSIPVIVFDREIVNQDLYVTHVDVQSTKPLNYYIELEVLTLSDDEAQAAILKSIRTG